MPDLLAFVEVNMTGFFTVGPNIAVHVEAGRWWATCPGCPGFSAAADSWEELFRLVSEWHASDEAPHRGWLMVQSGFTTTTTAGGPGYVS